MQVSTQFSQSPTLSDTGNPELPEQHKWLELDTTQQQPVCSEEVIILRKGGNSFH